MPYSIPTFNLTVNIHRGDGNCPPLTALFLATTANLSPGRREAIPIIAGVSEFFFFILLPVGTDVRSVGIGPMAFGDMIECPAASGIWYQVNAVQDVAKGFANEYRRAACNMCIAPAPLP